MFKIFARAIIKNEKGEFLLVKKLNSQKIAPGKTLLPGGTLEFDEEIEDCLIREIKEETGLEITEIKFATHEKIMMDGVHRLGCYYECKTKNLDFVNMEPDKHEKVFWGTKENYNVVGKHILNYL
ncbi:MAG: NUDIX hydrolase [Candidatus Gracilibacteria bacterium]|nr:NUDIX hydrolase [Candidatus Gracilibacteria bacterium]